MIGELQTPRSCRCFSHQTIFSCRSPDTIFYGSPRFVTHIDDPAIRALTKYYDSVFPPSNTPGVALLDMCSSWVGFSSLHAQLYTI